MANELDQGIGGQIHCVISLKVLCFPPSPYRGLDGTERCRFKISNIDYNKVFSLEAEVALV
jgi:hypothetical protein